MKTTIEENNLSELDVWNVVREWYTNGMYGDILQNEEGDDLEEICELFIMLNDETIYKD
mgnify:FL=1|tara:strand:- start:390 stop:566 length:177 start_codon:yes stop_codon:yes gene_type:complete